MNYDRDFGFIGGFAFGGFVAGAVALLFAPASGQEMRELIRFEGTAFNHRSQVFRDDNQRQVNRLIKQRQKEVVQAQARLGEVIDEGKNSLRAAMGVSK